VGQGSKLFRSGMEHEATLYYMKISIRKQKIEKQNLTKLLTQQPATKYGITEVV